MRNRSTRVIVGLLLLTGVATSGLKQAGLLTGQVVPTLSCSSLSTTLTFSEGSPSLVPATMESFPRYGTNNNPPHYAPLPYSNPPSYQSAGVRISVDPVVARWVYVAAGLPPKAAGATAPTSPGGTLLSTIMQSGTSTGTPTELPALTTTIAFVNPSSGAAATALGSSISMWVYSQAGTVNLKSFDAAGVLLEQKSAPASTTVQFSTGNVARIELVSNYPAGGVAIDNLQYTLNLSCSSASSAATSSAAQCMYGGYEYQLTTTGLGYGQSGPAPAGEGWTMNNNVCLVSNASAQCVTNAVLWRRHSDQAKDAVLTSCANPGAGYVLKTQIPASAPLQAICLWEKNATAPVDLMLGHAGTGLPIDMHCNTTVNGSEGSVDKPPAEYVFQSRICVVSGGTCSSDLCLFGKTLNACPAPVLVGRWNFDAATTTTAPDSSGKGNNGTVAGATPLNGCMQFDGNDYINLGPIGNQMTQNALTFTAWAKKEDGGGGIDPAGNQNNTPVLISTEGGGVGYFSTTGSSGMWGFGGDGANSTPVNPGTFYHIALTTDGQTEKLYINGILNATKVINRSVANIPGNFTIGTASRNNLSLLWGYFKGTMDDVRLYNGVLSASEIAAIAAVQPSCAASTSSTSSSAAQCTQTDPAYCGPKGCPAGFLAYSSKTYLRYDTAAGSWDSARAHCQSIGGDLVSINNAGEQTAVYEGLVGTGRHDVWIGLSDSAAEGTFKWVDGTTPSYTNWYTGNPDDGYFNEDCVEMNYKNHPQTGKWNDFRCSDGEGDNTGFICELPQNCDPSFVDIKVNGQDGTISVAPNTPVTITWTSRGVVSCDTGTAPAPWGPNKAIATSGSQQYTPASTQTIGIQCTSVGATNRDVQDSVAMVLTSVGQCPVSALNFSNAGSYTSVTTQYQAQGVRFSTDRKGTASTSDPKAVVSYSGSPFGVFSPSNKSNPINGVALATYNLVPPSSPAPTLIIEFVTPNGTPKTVSGSSVSFYARTISNVRGSNAPANPGTATSYDAAGKVLETKALYGDQTIGYANYNSVYGLTYDQVAAQMKVQFTIGSIAKIVLRDNLTVGVTMDDLSFMGDCNNATCISNTIPDRLSPGQSFTATATVANNGTKTWTGNSYYAGIANYASWGLTNAGASWAGWPTASIAPGQSATLNISGKAPSTPGNYTYSYQMLQNGVESFGAVCSKTIIVEEAVCSSSQRSVSLASQSPGTTISPSQFQSAGIKFSGSPNATLTIQNYSAIPPNGMGSSNFPSAFLYVNAAGQTITIQAVDPVTGQPIETEPGSFQVNARPLGNFNTATLPNAGIEIKAYDLAGNLVATATKEANLGFGNVVPSATQKISKITIVGMAARNTYETNSPGFAIASVQYSTYCPLELSCKAGEFDASKGTFVSQGWIAASEPVGSITPVTTDGVPAMRIVDNSSTTNVAMHLPIPASALEDKDWFIEMRAKVWESNLIGNVGMNTFMVIPNNRKIGLYISKNRFGPIGLDVAGSDMAYVQSAFRNTTDAFHTYTIQHKKNASGISDDSINVYFDGVKVLSDILVSSINNTASASNGNLVVGQLTSGSLATMDVAYIKFSNDASPCIQYASTATPSCGVSEFYASDGTFEQQGWTSVADSDANTNLTGPVTENGVSYVRLADQSTATGMRTSDTRITDAMLSDRDWTLEMKSRTVLSDPNGYVLGMNMLLATPSNVSTSLFIEPSKFGLQAATPNAYTWGPSVSRNTSDAFHTYVIKNKKNAAGASDDAIDVYFDGTKVLSDIPRSQLYVYTAGTGVQGISFGIGSSPGKGTMDVSYVRFKNDEATCPADPFKKVAPQCSDGKDNDGDGKIDYATETEVLVKTWGPVSVSPGGASVVAATGLQAGQFIKPTIATGGALCENIVRGNSNGYYVAGVFTDDAGTYIQALPPNAPASRSIPFVSDPAWPLDIFKVPNGATQLKVFMPTGITYTGTCTLSGKVFEMQRSSNWPGDPECTSASDDSESGLTCTDSDGGNKPLVKGFVNATGGSVATAADSCNANGTLQEYFCDASNTIQSAITACDTGSSCVDGACKASSSSSSTATILNPSRTGFGGVAFEGGDIIYMPLQNGDLNSYHGNVLSYGPVCKPGVCGDGTLTSDEQCDDGNTRGGDGCSAKCIWEPYGAQASNSSSSSSQSSARCGDRIIASPEKCDDGNQRGGDGCSAFCQVETGWQCTPRLP